jgi:hypothetical protein
VTGTGNASNQRRVNQRRDDDLDQPQEQVAERPPREDDHSRGAGVVMTAPMTRPMKIC